MAISVGDQLPEAELILVNDEGDAPTALSGLLAGRKVALFGMPGAFTSTCSNSHLPSIAEAMPALKAKGVDAVYVMVVNDPFVITAWRNGTGADEAGIDMLGDADSAFTKALGLEFSFAGKGFYDRTSRFSMIVEDGKVTAMNREEPVGNWEPTSGGVLAEQA